jgi:hypothetical protein
MTSTTSQSVTTDTMTSTTSQSVTTNTVVSMTATTATAGFDFFLSNSGITTVNQGSSGSNTITVTGVRGPFKPISLSCSGLPSGASCSFNPASNMPPYLSTLTIKTSASTPKGMYTITVTGTNGGKTHTTQFTLVVS